MSYSIDSLDPATVQCVADELRRNERSEVWVSDGLRLVFQVLPDEFAYVRDDEDRFGKIAECRRDRTRPEGFDGGARKVSSWYGDTYWWQPPADVIGNTQLIDSLRSELVDILNMGYSLVSVELQELCSHGDWHTVTGTSIGGLGPNTDFGVMVPEVMCWLHDCQEMVA